MVLIVIMIIHDGAGPCLEGRCHLGVAPFSSELGDYHLGGDPHLLLPVPPCGGGTGRCRI